MITKRLFIAIEIPAKIKTYLQNLQVELNLADRLRWTKMDNFHLTLQFLGDVTNDKIVGLSDRLTQELATLPIFELKLSSLGAFYFPRSQNARVVWVDMTGETEILQRIYQSTLIATKVFGFEPDHSTLKPHLTLGRSQKWLNQDDFARINQAINQVLVRPLCFSVSKVALIQSRLYPQGAIYTQLSAINLVSKSQSSQLSIRRT